MVNISERMKDMENKAPEINNFIEAFIEEDIAAGGQYEGMTVHTRFPPEPNGYLHIGHCKALCINFGTAEKFNGLCNLRMDDTNPAKEDAEYVKAIQDDIHWLGFDWGDRFFYGSDYFEKDYEYAVELIKKADTASGETASGLYRKLADAGEALLSLIRASRGRPNKTLKHFLSDVEELLKKYR